MTRKESEKDSERPHYYSQFWLDVAAGRRIIGAPKPNEEGEPGDTEVPEVSTPPVRKATRASETEPAYQARATADGHVNRAESRNAPVVEPVVEADDYSDGNEVEVVDSDLDEDYQETELEDADIPDVDLGSAEDEPEEEEFFDEASEEEEEEEDEENWGRGRKKARPTRATKPAPNKRPGSKRDSRRNF